ncbi:NAD(P)-dependent oxidoreductase [Nocardia sp. CNY236]|uniref:NAD-dependent epimerase/dehydratase family protein n=1 Tax=Nocardia sp. CNY236 TaxID=1169152 RepID=UPI000402C9C8|nr:NAD(P)-dependent oxidoreductase [Nocardia sp. CNY236]
MTAVAPPRALVLGATGFVGRHICSALRGAGYEISAVARRQPVDPPDGKFVALDIGAAAPAVLRELIDSYRPDVLVNTVGSIWGRTDEHMWSAAAQPVHQLVTALQEAEHRPWLVHLGSVLEYGAIGEGRDASAQRSVARPTSAYGEAKLAATNAVLGAVSAGRADAVVLRVANVAGPGSPEVSLLGRVAAHLLDAARSGTAAEITLDALVAHRDYVDVRDVADAVAAAARVRMPGAVFDIGRGEATSVRDLVAMLISASGVQARLIERTANPAQSAATAWTRVDIRDARERLGWEPRRSLRESIEAFWRDVCRECDV